MYSATMLTLVGKEVGSKVGWKVGFLERVGKCDGAGVTEVGAGVGAGREVDFTLPDSGNRWET